MKTMKTIGGLRPFAREAIENEYAIEKLRSGAENLAEGSRALATGREHPPRRWPKRVAVAAGVVGVTGAAVGFAAKELQSAL